MRDIPKLTKEMVQLEGEDPVRATDAARQLYELCDVAHKYNREPMVATVPGNTLIIADTSGFHRRMPSPGATVRVEVVLG